MALTHNLILSYPIHGSSSSSVATVLKQGCNPADIVRASLQALQQASNKEAALLSGAALGGECALDDAQPFSQNHKADEELTTRSLRSLEAQRV